MVKKRHPPTHRVRKTRIIGPGLLHDVITPAELCSSPGSSMRTSYVGVLNRKPGRSM